MTRSFPLLAPAHPGPRTPVRVVAPFRLPAFALLTLMAGAAFAPPALAQSNLLPERGAASHEPAHAWERSFLSGNGRMGALAFGVPGDETVVMNHARLFLPINSGEVVPDIGPHLSELRAIIRAPGGGHNRAAAFAAAKGKEAGWGGRLQFTDPFHPGFFLKITGEAANARDYLRTENFETGEVVTRWTVDGREQRRQLFVSRADNVAVLALTGEGGVTCDLEVLPVDPAAQVRAYQLNHPDEPKENSAVSSLIQSERKVSADGVAIHNAYKFGKGGYDAALRVLVDGGGVESDGQRITIRGAARALVLMRIEPFKQGEPAPLANIRAELAKLPDDYGALLTRHVAIHGDLFHRVRTDFGGGSERRRTTDELLAQAAKENAIPPALLEKIYDGSRYVILSASGDRPPNLQGIWTGTWQPSWSGDYTLDTNLELAIAHQLSAGTPELLHGCFNLIDEYLPDWRLNAKNLFGARGIRAPLRESNHGKETHWSDRFHGMFWNCGAGWLAHWHYDYYRHTGDREFLAKRAVPFMREAAQFYEDFLFKDDGGKLRFSPSMSAENGDGDNSTQDLAVARELFTNLIAACEELKVEPANVPKWRALLAALPPYLVLPNGELQEWATPGTPNKNNHRHLSHLYPLFQSAEFDPVHTPELWRAAETAYLARLNEWFRNPENVGAKKGNETASHGRMHLALCAARLGRGEEVWELLTRMASAGSIYPSMAAAHYERGKVFNVDANGAMPEVLNQSLLFSRPGELALLPALPRAMAQGEIRGLRAQGQITVNRLKWEAGRVEIELVSGRDQTLMLSLPRASELNRVDVTAGEAELAPATTANARRVSLRGGRPVTLNFQFH